jgi:hypothetical protein
MNSDDEPDDGEERHVAESRTKDVAQRAAIRPLYEPDLGGGNGHLTAAFI